MEVKIKLRKVNNLIHTHTEKQTDFQANKQQLENINQQLKFIKPHIRSLNKKVKNLTKEKRALLYQIKKK